MRGNISFPNLSIPEKCFIQIWLLGVLGVDITHLTFSQSLLNSEVFIKLQPINELSLSQLDLLFVR